MIRKTQLCLTVATVALLAPGAAWAQEAPVTTPESAAGAAAASASTADVTAATDGPAENGGGLEEIVVTAQKRAQNLLDVPVSVSAISAESIRANRIQNVLDLNAVVPNLTVRASPGGSNLPTFVMRGQFASGGTPGSEKQIGFYLDGVYVGSTGGSAFDLGNIARIEVLRGPQGTLFGQNATAGAISIYTADPTGKFGGTIEGTIGNYDQRRIRASLDAPLFGPFSGYVAFEHFERRGDIRNSGAGTAWNYSASDPKLGAAARSPKTLGDTNRETVQVALKYDAGNDLTATYKYFWSENNATPEGVGFIDFIPAGAGPALAPRLEQLRASQPELFQRQLERPKSVNNWFTLPSRFKNQGHIVTAQWSATDSLSLKNTFGYLKSSLVTTNQVGGVGGLINTVPQLGPVGAPYILLGQTTEQTNKQWSNELQVTFDIDALTLTSGYLHYDYKGTDSGRGNAAASLFFAPLPNFAVPAATSGQLSSVHTKADAVYTQAEFHITPQLDVILGGRYTWDDKVARTTLRNLIPVITYEDSRASYSAGVSYKPNDDIMLFGKYSKAYVAGGSFAGWTWKPEVAKSWEAGVKAELLDRRLRTALTLFHVDYTNVQNTTSGTTLANQTGRAELRPISSTIANAGDMRARGFEFEATAVPVERLTIGGSFGYTDADNTRVEPLFGGRLDSFDLNFRSKYTAAGNIQYDTLPLFGDAFLRLRLDANYRSKYDAIRINYTPYLATVFSPATTIINGRAALTNIALGSGEFEIAGWVRNLTNEKPLSYPISTPFIVSTTYERARTFGVDASFRF